MAEKSPEMKQQKPKQRDCICDETEICWYCQERLDRMNEKLIKQARQQAELATLKILNGIINKFDSNWFYCQQKEIYGNDILNLLNEIVDDLKEAKAEIKKLEVLK